MRTFVLYLFVSVFVACGPTRSKSKDPNRDHTDSLDDSLVNDPGSPTYDSAGQGGGVIVGNGGSGIVCLRDKKITHIELFDFYEASVLRDWRVDLTYTPDVSKSLLEQGIETAQHVIDSRWKPIDPVIAEFFTEKLKDFSAETMLLDKPMTLIDDLESLLIPPAGCRREQIAIQRSPEYRGDKRYYFRKAIFEHPKFSNKDRAGLILHELIYRMTTLGGAETSRGARYLTALFFANQQQTLLRPLENYFKIAQQAQLPWAGANGTAIVLDRFWITGDFLGYGIVVPGAHAETIFGRKQLACEANFGVNGKAHSFLLWTLERFDVNLPIYGSVSVQASFGFTMDPMFERTKQDLVVVCDDKSRWTYKSFSRNEDGATEEHYYLSFVQPPIRVEAKNKFLTFSERLSQDVELIYSKKIGSNDLIPKKISGSFESACEPPAAMVTFMSNDKCAFHHVENYDDGDNSHLVTLEFSECLARVHPDSSWLKFSELVTRESDETGKKSLITLNLTRTSAQSITHQTKAGTITLKVFGTVTIDEDGELVNAILAEDTDLCIGRGGSRRFASGKLIRFGDDGCVIESDETP